jgi:hypothetical protein
MRSLSLTFCAAAAVAVIALPASAAAADSEPPDRHKGSVWVTPSTVAPGEQVELRVDACGKGTSATGDSKAFVSQARFAPADGRGLFAEARISSDAAPRDYEIRVNCKDGGGKATGTVTVAVHSRPSPVAPVRAGGGGTSALAAEQATTAPAHVDRDGPGTRHAVTGLALAAAAALAVAFRGVRRRRSVRR